MSTSLLAGLSALILVVASAIVWFRAALAVNLPKNRTPYVVIWVISAVLAVTALTGTPGWLGGGAAVIALLGSAFFLFTVSISQQKLGDQAIRPGATIPAFSAPDETGTIIESSTFSGQPLLIKFFRGHW
ncbi:MAG: hypothetical protein AAF993_06475 [Pseudomonadota bacterium]